MDESDAGGGITRAGFLKAAAVAVPGILLGGTGAAAATAKPAPSRRLGRTRGLGGMNVLVFLTDQQRAIQHFPPGWGRRNMPGLTRLQEHGMLFEYAFTNACMCSPARSTLMSGFFPAQHGVKYTLETDMPAPQYPQVELSTCFKNLASVSRAAGYTPVYKGKFHCNKPANGSTPARSRIRRRPRSWSRSCPGRRKRPRPRTPGRAGSAPRGAGVWAGAPTA